MSNATEMHFAAQLLAREFARGEVTLSDDDRSVEYHIRAVQAYCSEFLCGSPINAEDRSRLAADVYARVHREMYGG